MRSKAVLLVTLILVLAGCAVQLGPSTAPAPGQSPAPVQPAGTMPPLTAVPVQPTRKAVPSTAPTLSPKPTLAQPSAGTPTPTSAPMAPAPAKGCGTPPASLSELTEPSSSLTQDGVEYYLVGRTLVVDFELVDSWGTDAGDLHRIQSESCMNNLTMEYDWIYTAHYSRYCPSGISYFPEPASGDFGPYGYQTYLGREFYLDGRLKDSAGTTSGAPYTESGRCQDHDWRYVIYFEIGPPGPFPAEANTLLLLGSGVTTLAGWAALQIRRRKRGGARRPPESEP